MRRMIAALIAIAAASVVIATCGEAAEPAESAAGVCRRQRGNRGPRAAHGNGHSRPSARTGADSHQPTDASRNPAADRHGRCRSSHSGNPCTDPGSRRRGADANRRPRANRNACPRA